ncbi:MAG: hypothetical protein AB4058_06465 [Microcystaceae cyanobacterium]
MIGYFAQLSGAGGAGNVVNSSQAIMRANAASWNKLWNDAVAPDSELWIAIVGLSKILLGFALIYAFYKYSTEIFNGREYNFSKIIELLTPSLLVGLLLLNDGYFLATGVKLVRDVSYDQISRVYEVQINGISLREATESLQQTATANADARALFRDCIRQTGEEFQTCVNDTAKQEGLQEIVTQNNHSLAGNFAQVLCTLSPACAITNAVSTGISNGWNPSQILSDLFASPFIAIAQSILTALQWAVSNGIELALLLTALFAPIAAALTIMPLAGGMFFSWASGFLALISFSLGYALLSGLMALTIFSMQSSSGNASGLAGIPELFSDLGFLLFTAVVSPLIAGGVATFGGVSLFQGFSNAASDGLKAVTSVVTSVATMGAKR